MTGTQLIYFGVGVFSLLIGSFLNVVIYRLPQMLYFKSRINLCFPRSFCPQCKITIPIWHNIPIVSYLINQARCFHCRKRIPVQYPMVEILTVILSLWAIQQFGFGLHGFFAVLFIDILICLAFIDLQHQLLPDILTFLLIWSGLFCNTFHLFISPTQAIEGAMAGYVSLWSFTKLYALIRKKVAMGHGDFKLFAGFGAWFGWEALPTILLISAMLGAVFGFGYLTYTKKPSSTPIPFGPFLCVGGLLVLFFNLRFY